MAPMTEQSKPASAWSKRVAFLRGATTRANEFADLLATVDPCWHAAVQVVNSDVVVRIMPAEDTLTRGLCLRISRSKSGFSMDLSRNQSLVSSTTVARARPTLLSAPAALARMLSTMLEQREVTLSRTAGETWDATVGSFRAYAAEDAAKADLLESVDAALRERCEIYDNSQAFGIIRIGDADDDGHGIWISQVREGWSFIHRVESPRDHDARILGEATARAENAAGILKGLLREMVSGMPAPELSAQDSYRQLLRVHVGPALRHDGYKGSAGIFHRTVDEYEVLIQFQKSKFSIRPRVDYRLNISVCHPATAELFNQANKEAYALGRVHESASAGMYHGELPQLMRDGRQWISLRPDEDLTSHGAMLLAASVTSCIQP